MSQPRDPDVLIDAFFEQDAPDLPDRAFDAVRRDIHRTRQRTIFVRGRWSEAPAVARALAAAAAILLVVGLALLSLFVLGLGGAAPSPEPSAARFRSPLYAYSVAIPRGWSATPALVRWDGETQPSLGSTVDELSGPHLIALGFAGPFAGDLAAFTQDRIAANARDHADTCAANALQGQEPITFGGQPGVLLTWSCGALVDQAITVHAGVAYAFTIRDVDFKPALDPADFAAIRSMLDSVSFPTTPITSP